LRTVALGVALLLCGCVGVQRTPCLHETAADTDGTVWREQRSAPVQAGLLIALLPSAERDTRHRRHDWFAASAGRWRLYAYAADERITSYDFAPVNGTFALTQVVPHEDRSICVHD